MDTSGLIMTCLLGFIVITNLLVWLMTCGTPVVDTSEWPLAFTQMYMRLQVKMPNIALKPLLWCQFRIELDSSLTGISVIICFWYRGCHAHVVITHRVSYTNTLRLDCFVCLVPKWWSCVVAHEQHYSGIAISCCDGIAIAPSALSFWASVCNMYWLARCDAMDTMGLAVATCKCSHTFIAVLMPNRSLTSKRHRQSAHNNNKHSNYELVPRQNKTSIKKETDLYLIWITNFGEASTCVQCTSCT